MELANPIVLLLISPVVLAAWFAVRKGVSRPLMISRVIILSLLIIALASPFTIGTTTVVDEAPRITVLSDQTMSMDIFNKDTGQKIFEAIKSKTPSTFRQFSGLNSPIGDEVIGAAENNNIVLVSDGNNNYGKDLFDAIPFVSNMGTRVFAIKQKPVHNDMSVEISSPKNLIKDNENVINIVVRQAGNDARYRLDVTIDGKAVNLAESNIAQSERMKIIPVSVVFNKLGKHEIKATITPNSEDWFNVNNVFYKSVYVVPKPKVLALTDDTTTPLYKVANGLYEVTTVNDIPDDLSTYKAVIIDNRGAAELSADTLRNYVGGGGGLVVVGGDSSYDKGSYNNSPVEALLPIISRAAEYRGGKNIVIVLDSSGSTSSVVGINPIIGSEKLKYEEERTVIGELDALAISVIRNIGRDSNVAVVAFGGKTEQTELKSMSSESNRNELEAFVRNIGPQSGDNPTDLDRGFQVANNLLQHVSGVKKVIVLSDGILPPEGYQQAVNIALELKNSGVEITLIQMVGQIPQPSSSRTPLKFYGQLADALGVNVNVYFVTERPNLISEPSGTPEPTPTQTPEAIRDYGLAAVDTEHFITKYINLTASVTGYNEVIPKLGSNELVATSPGGKPILTTWGFGLGRVASFTTDDGGGMTMWASMVYSGENSRLISGMINWAIGDPRPKEGVVVQAEDIWGGTPGRVLITSNTLPQVKLDGKSVDLSRTGPTTYEATINPDKEGFHDLSGYGIAVNYPLEYRDVGFNEKLNTVIESNGGRVYDAEGVEGLLLMDIKEKATRTVEEPQSEKMPFLLAALGLFLIEVIVRRMKDYRKERPNIEENPPRVMPEAAVEAGVAE